MAVLTEKQGRNIIIGASIAIPLVVTILYLIPGIETDTDFTFLPLFNAIVNGTTSFLLLVALWAVKTGRVKLHRSLMMTSLLLSVMFLISYVTYHFVSESTAYGGVYKSVYYFILITHILLAIAIVPLVLISTVRALTDQVEKHKKIARITWPIWFYVTITGVVVYIMISPYYA